MSTAPKLPGFSHLHLSCNGFHQRRPMQPPSWFQSLGTAYSSRSRGKHLLNSSEKSLCAAQAGRTLQSALTFNITPHLCCHDKTGGSGVDGDVTSHQPHVLEFLIHLSVFLVGEGLDGTGEDHSLFLSERQCNGIPARGGDKHQGFISTNILGCFFM